MEEGAVSSSASTAGGATSVAASTASLKRKKSSTLTREADPPPPLPAMAAQPAGSKPQLPVKPAHIRPGLKPVKIPTVDDKLWVSIGGKKLEFYLGSGQVISEKAGYSTLLSF